MATYTLTAMQRKAFTQRFSIYAPDVTPIRSGTTKTIGKVRVTPHSTNVHGRIMSTPDFGSTSPSGRVNRDYLDTTDRVRLNISQAIEDSWYIKDQSTSDWYVAVGGPNYRRWRANELWCYVKRVAEPDIYTGGGSGVDQSQEGLE